jgi:hypothetical protein
VLAAVLLGLWTGLALSVLVAYRPGGPWDTLVAAAAFVPVPVAALAVIWPPSVAPWRPAVAIGWLGIGATLLVAPILLLEIRALSTGGRQALLPSAEVAYAVVLALGATCLFSALGQVADRQGRDVLAGPGLVRAVGLATLLTTGTSVVFGGAALANELALREAPTTRSRYGPTEVAGQAPACDEPPILGAGTRLAVRAEARVDGRIVGRAALSGERDAADESWSGFARGRTTSLRVGYARVGGDAWLAIDRDPAVTSVPDPFGMAGDDDLTVDGPVAATASKLVPEDLGTELVGGARARHCRGLIDGPAAIAAAVPLRWLAGGEPVEVRRALLEWRGSLDWWVFLDGQLGQAIITVSGSPGDAWPTGGLQGSLSAVITALDRDLPHVVLAPPGAP